MKKKYLRVAAGILLIYVLLVGTLLVAERSWPGQASIRTPGDAVWYTFVTLTTVGYGDKTPESPVGKMIGGVFLLLSLGFLTAVVSLAFSMVRGSLLPRIRLLQKRRTHWYVFDSTGPESVALARKLAGQTVVFLLPPGGQETPLPGIAIMSTVQTLAAIAKNGMTFFVLGQDAPESIRRSAELEKYGKVYCCTEWMQPRKTPNLNYMSPSEACARMYWKEHPLRPEEKKIVLIGGKHRMPRLLRQALLVNVLDIRGGIRYDLYGDMAEFLADHRKLHKFCGINQDVPGKDSLYFHDGQPDAQVLAQADRIVLCLDSDAENIAMLSRILHSYPTRAQLYIHLDQEIQGLAATSFGTQESLYTPENVMRHQLEQCAMERHARYNAHNPEYAVAWEDLSEYARGSNLASADHQAVKVRLLLEDFSITEPTKEQEKQAAEACRQKYPARKDWFRKLEHQRWERYLYLNNWEYGEKRDNILRIHPLLCPYETLPETERVKDDGSWLGIGS